MRETVSGKPRRVKSEGGAVLPEKNTPSADSLRSKYQVLSGPSEAELLLTLLASNKNLLKLDNNIPALAELQSHSTEALVRALTNLISEDKLGDKPLATIFRLVDLFPLQDIPKDQKEAMQESIKKSAFNLLEASQGMGVQISSKGETLFNLPEAQAKANLAENNIMTTLIQHLNDRRQERRIRNIALVFNKRIIDDSEKSPYLKAFREYAMSLISKAVNDSTFIKQQTKAQRLAQDIDSEKKITFTEVGMTAMIKALSLFNEQYAKEHVLRLFEKAEY